MSAYSMLNNLGFGDWILSCFDIIPKIIYLMYACLASAADAMQLLVRRLCGLDIYYLDGETVKLTDPLTEFINGILGVGNSSGTMQALNTTFWSLAIFALILLALTSIVAIIKAHYNEDVGATSPSKILYGAFKSILTFAIVPVVVVIGFQISGLLLRTLDNITAGTVSEESISGIYGTDNNFAPVGERNGSQVYSSYDLFGFTQPATNSPISGQLFRAAAYQSNRFRLGTYTTSNVNGNGPNLSMGVFGEGPSYDSAEDQNEYLAYQVDYAFMNSLQLERAYSYTTLRDNANNAGNRIDVSNDFHSGNLVENFSKYNVSLIWVYYDLWQFNFIIAFAGAISVFGIMLSIIIGLMMRLIKSAAMFLIYPPLLGLAPMDNFKAFKSWANEFIKQILSAFGAIVGINLLFLILPYVQAISFFNQWFLDGIVNLVFLATGLIMVKDFISMVAGFVGGGDVFSTGEGAKGQVAGTLKKGTMAAVGAGAGFLGASVALPALTARGIARRNAARQVKNIDTDKQLVSNYSKAVSQANARADAGEWKNDEKYIEHMTSTNDDLNTTYQNALKLAQGTDDERKKFARERVAQQMESTGLYKKDEFVEFSSRAEKQALDERRKHRTSYLYRNTSQGEDKLIEQLGSEEGRKILLDSFDDKKKKKIQRNYLNEDGTLSAAGAGAMMRNVASQTLGPLKLFAKDITGALNLDKLSGTFKTLTFAATGRDSLGNQAIKSTEWKSSDHATSSRAKLEAEAIKQGLQKGTPEFADYVRDKTREGVVQGIKDAVRSIGSVVMPGANKGAGEVKYTGEKLQSQQLKATEKQIKASETTNEKIEKLITTMESFIKNNNGNS